MCKNITIECKTSENSYWELDRKYLIQNNLKIIPFVENIFDEDSERLLFDRYFINQKAIISLLGDNEMIYLNDYPDILPSDIYLTLHFLYFVLISSDEKVMIFNDNDYYHIWIGKEENLKGIFGNTYKQYINNFYNFYKNLKKEVEVNLDFNPYVGIINIYNNYKDFFLK
ncbi:MAG: hypothetical protein ACI4N3_01565 [Alphaproteobacteria bacterium]